MEILPAIDLRDGQVVRLLRGDYARQTTYSSDPAAVAGDFVRAGATWIHMVDLDAARSGRFAHADVVRAVCESSGAKVELGGGARDDKAVEAMLACGVDRVIVGSAALRDWAWFEGLVRRPQMAGRIALGLDARDGRLAVDGWTRQVDATAANLAAQVKGWPVAAIIYTDIARDGMLSGVNFEATAEVVAATDVPVIASGGVCGLEDVAQCKQIDCAGVIIGKAYYEGRIDLGEAIELARR